MNPPAHAPSLLGVDVFTVATALAALATFLLLFALYTVAGGIFILRGRTQPGYTVRAAGRVTMTNSDGRFQLQINVDRATRELNVLFETPQGKSRTYRVPLKRTAGA